MANAKKASKERKGLRKGKKIESVKSLEEISFHFGGIKQS
jgi:hypothetical protein